jgi:FkbH-like protein
MDALSHLEKISRERGLAHLLWRNDFAVHRINWNDKATNIRQIASQLGLATNSILFIDDNAAERQAVQSALPGIRTLGENLYRVRSELLSNPCLQKNVQTAESAARTELVRAQLARETFVAAAHEEHDFLTKLDIRLTITRARNTSRLARLVELLQRTNQFNTTLARLSAAQIAEYLQDPGRSAYVLEVSDRFATYGMVGVCLLCHNEIFNFAMSCRVIPLHADIPFLTAVLQWRGAAPVSGRIVQGPRNQPCRDLYLRAGFAQVGAGHFLLDDLEKLPRLKRDIYHIELIEDPAPSAMMQGYSHREDIQPCTEST